MVGPPRSPRGRGGPHPQGTASDSKTDCSGHRRRADGALPGRFPPQPPSPPRSGAVRNGSGGADAANRPRVCTTSVLLARSRSELASPSAPARRRDHRASHPAAPRSGSRGRHFGRGSCARSTPSARCCAVVLHPRRHSSGAPEPLDSLRIREQVVSTPSPPDDSMIRAWLPGRPPSTRTASGAESARDPGRASPSRPPPRR